MKIKPISYSEVKAKALQNPDVKAAYLAEKREDELQEFRVNMHRQERDTGRDEKTSLRENFDVSV
ncbi:hypothetical protein [Xenorhabdus bovienii]|uniref:hypothetical protein n=1 Tax=Xenorhabdus bovienii TaxID=40576 RepID=UPI0023B357D9|nr:hypothetical protein [Xenorhabdus bovienii]